MKIVTWNVNSIRVRLPRLVAYLQREQPDVMCLQEIKCEEAHFPYQALAQLGYQALVVGQKSYNGVCLLSRLPLQTPCWRLADNLEDDQARLIAAKLNNLHIVCVYVPNGQEVGSTKFAYKLRWLARLRTFLRDWCPAPAPLLVCGDFNIVPRIVDMKRPEVWQDGVLFCPEVRAAWQALCTDYLVDIFAVAHPEGGHYSWWDYRRFAFPKNDGLRIDAVLASPLLAKHVVDVGIDRDSRKGKLPSDHAPVWAQLTWP